VAPDSQDNNQDNNNNNNNTHPTYHLSYHHPTYHPTYHPTNCATYHPTCYSEYLNFIPLLDFSSFPRYDPISLKQIPISINTTTISEGLKWTLITNVLDAGLKK
jgi:hypothetical protein